MKVLIAIVLLSFPLLAREVTVSIPFAGGKYKVTFDDSKFSKAQVQEIYRISSELASATGYLVADSLEICADADVRYKECGTRDIKAKNFLRNAEVNIRTSQDRLNYLRGTALPEELKVVQKYLEEFLSYGLRLEKCRLQYYKTWNENVLESCDALEGAKECDAVANKAAVVTDRLEKYRLARYDWPNCIVDHQNARLGEYPEQAWKKFLEKYGIKETVVLEDND